MIRLVASVILIFILFPAAILAQKPGKVFPQGTAGVDYNLRNPRGKKEGPWIRLYKNHPDVLYYRGQFSNGVPTGSFEFYNQDGSLSSVVNHVQDSTINDVTYYHADGRTVKSAGRYTGSLQEGKWVRKKEGVWKTYDAAGVLRAEEAYTADQLDGSCKYFYASGAMVGIYSYKGGQLDGPFTTWYDNGKKDKEGAYLRGDLEGKYQSWYESGQPEMEGSYALGVKEGTWFFFNRNGLPEVTILYKKGTETKRRFENGTFTDHYPSGIPKSEYTYEDGKKNGPFREWYDLGQFVQVPGSKEDAEIGIMFRQKLEGTQLRVQGDYVDDHPEGEVIYYTDRGSIQKIEVWEGGKCVATRTP